MPRGRSAYDSKSDVCKLVVPMVAAVPPLRNAGRLVASSWHDQHGANAKRESPYAIGLWGDLPY